MIPGGNCFSGAASGSYRSPLSSSLNAVFPEVTLVQASNGQIDYFCVGVVNTITSFYFEGWVFQ
jgi:hypothetical protein